MNANANGKRTITMYNVGFGDCFLIKDYNDAEKSNFLVDFGSKHAAKNYVNVVNDLNKELSIGNNSLLISHFHEDHYKLIKQLNVKFDNIYIRNDISIISEVRFTLLELVLYSKYNPRYKEALFRLNKIGNLGRLLKSGGHIVFVREGDVIKAGRTRYNVLSPFLDDYDSSLDHLWELIEKYEGVEECFTKVYALLRKSLEKEYFINKDNIKDDRDHYVEECQQYIERICFSNKIDENEEIDRIIEKGITDVLTDVLKIKEKYSKEIKNITSLFNKNHYNYAITDIEHILNVSIISEDGRLLMFGDEYHNYIGVIMHELKEKHVIPNYIIKPAHHGTIHYYTPIIGHYEYLLAPHYLFSNWHYDNRNDFLCIERFKNKNYVEIEDKAGNIFPYYIELPF